MNTEHWSSELRGTVHAWTITKGGGRGGRDPVTLPMYKNKQTSVLKHTGLAEHAHSHLHVRSLIGLRTSAHWFKCVTDLMEERIRGRCHGGRPPSSDDSPTVIPPSALDKTSIMKRYHRRRTCSHNSPRRSPTMVTFMIPGLSSADDGMTAGLSSVDGRRPP